MLPEVARPHPNACEAQVPDTCQGQQDWGSPVCLDLPNQKDTRRGRGGRGQSWVPKPWATQGSEPPPSQGTGVSVCVALSPVKTPLVLVLFPEFFGIPDGVLTA